MSKTYRFGFIGAGAMASAIAGGMIKQGLANGSDIIMSDCSAEKLQELHDTLGIQPAADNNQVVSEAQYIIVAVKPQQFAAVCNDLSVKPQNHQAVI
ncbi:MAG: NAD(P)-binding domain-containing protein, partial [Peptococcaceae bacterium]|nr:NAD(P)-binding domain-containing protein [Peptococcaceae bacterium]